MKHNWNDLGAVTLKGPFVDTETFESLYDFVRSNRYRYSRFPLTDDSSMIERSWKSMESRLEFYSRADLPYYTHNYYHFHTNYCYLVDDLGIIIPLWKIEEVARLVDADLRREKAARRRMIYSCRRGRYRGWRHPKTLNEERNNRLDDDAIAYGVKVRAKRHYLPTAWDDQHRSDHRDNGWKNNRQTQYKTVDN